MSFLNYQAIQNKYQARRMQENIRRLKDYNIFHCLLEGNTDRANAVKNRVADLPSDFYNWLEVCDGGMLFDTAMLSTKSYDNKLELQFETYGDYYNIELRNSKNISDDWFIFAVAIHDDVFFFDLKKKDGKVYQWDIEEQKIHAVWLTFEDWLTDQINEAIELIANEELEPFDIKLEVESDE